MSILLFRNPTYQYVTFSGNTKGAPQTVAPATLVSHTNLERDDGCGKAHQQKTLALQPEL